MFSQRLQGKVRGESDNLAHGSQLFFLLPLNLVLQTEKDTISTQSKVDGYKSMDGPTVDSGWREVSRKWITSLLPWTQCIKFNVPSRSFCKPYSPVHFVSCLGCIVDCTANTEYG